MHALLFGIKRAFHSSVLVLRDFLSPFELTPARYDLLFIVREHKLTWLSEVRRMLGVTAATVSRMVKSLVDLGMVTVTRPPKDRRQLHIELTSKGDACMRRAMTVLRATGAIDFFVETMFGPPSKQRVPRMLDFQKGLSQVRRACGDTSSDPDPWLPPDQQRTADTYEYEPRALLESLELEPHDLGPADIPIPQ